MIIIKLYMIKYTHVIYFDHNLRRSLSRIVIVKLSIPSATLPAGCGLLRTMKSDSEGSIVLSSVIETSTGIDLSPDSKVICD